MASNYNGNTNRETFYAQTVSTDALGQGMSIAENEIIYFYVADSITWSSEQSINIKMAPFNKAGATQNLGRREYNITVELLLTDDEFGTKEEKLEKLNTAKEKNTKLCLTLPGLPLGSNIYFIKSLSATIKEPNRIKTQVSFIEVLEDSIKIQTMNLVAVQSLENIKALLKQLGIA